MKQSKGIVRKYSREYTRTLKNGQKKKYTTEQVQISIPKQDNVFDNNEEVLIIPYLEGMSSINDENNNLNEDYDDLVKENKLLKEKLASFENEKSSSFSNDHKDEFIFKLQEEYIDLSKKYENLQMELISLKSDQINNEYTIKRLKNFILNQD